MPFAVQNCTGRRSLTVTCCTGEWRLHGVSGWHVGYNIGAELAVPLGRRLALTGGVRVMPLPSDVRVVANVTNADRMIFEIPEAQVREFIGTQPARFTRWGAPEFTIGLRFAIH